MNSHGEPVLNKESLDSNITNEFYCRKLHFVDDADYGDLKREKCPVILF